MNIKTPHLVMNNCNGLAFENIDSATGARAALVRSNGMVTTIVTAGTETAGHGHYRL